MREERLERRRKEKAEQVAYKLEREIATWDPAQYENCTEDPFKTLFVARIVSDSPLVYWCTRSELCGRQAVHASQTFTNMFHAFFSQNYDTSESKLRREFEVFGAIKKIVLTNNADTGKPRGYAFIEYEHERDMHCK